MSGSVGSMAVEYNHSLYSVCAKYNGSSSSIEGVCGKKPLVTLDVMSNSPFVSQANTRQFGRRI